MFNLSIFQTVSRRLQTSIRTRKPIKKKNPYYKKNIKSKIEINGRIRRFDKIVTGSEKQIGFGEYNDFLKICRYAIIRFPYLAEELSHNPTQKSNNIDWKYIEKEIHKQFRSSYIQAISFASERRDITPKQATELAQLIKELKT